MIVLTLSKFITRDKVMRLLTTVIDIAKRNKSTKTKLHFNTKLTCSDPEDTPVLIIGQAKHLMRLKYCDLKIKLQPRVLQENFCEALKYIETSSKDTCSMYLNNATIAKLPEKCSRHNTPSRSHALTKLVKKCIVGVNESIVVVCERQDLYASACAVARAFPEFNKKTSLSKDCVNVCVEFIVVPSLNNCNLEISACDVLAFDAAAKGIRTAARIVDTPCNELNVSGFLNEIKLVGHSLGIKPKIICGEELKDRGIGGIYGVGKAATFPPALAVLSHCPSCAEKTIAWIGKGIVYDTGGLSIKSKTSMKGMKRDCAGAAGILGAFYAAVKNDFSQNLHAVFCLAENSVGPKSTRPDDIHTLYSGRTVEINNTDAEGRLVMADGVVYAKRDLKADIILDMATLSGAQGSGTGRYHAAIMSNDNEWEERMICAGRMSGDLTFPIPYCPELHFPEYKSEVADMKNCGKDSSNAPISVAGLFMASHLGFDYPGVFLHIDIAKPVWMVPTERASGFGIALLTTLFGKYSNHPLLNEIGPELGML